METDQTGEVETKRAEWTLDSEIESLLRLGPFEVCAWKRGEAYGGDFRWMAHGCSSSNCSKEGFPTLALAQADAVRWLRATIAEMAAACPEVE